ncbi:MAG: ATP:cob(I)alamin adenosyltransferase, partial [Parvularculaceae bacterium]
LSYTGDKHAERFRLDPGAVDALEAKIDEIQNELPPLKEFIYPGATMGGCALHQARVVARRAERGLALLSEEKRNAAIPFVNRLSDLLFVLAREADHDSGATEEGYREKKPR